MNSTSAKHRSRPRLWLLVISATMLVVLTVWMAFNQYFNSFRANSSPVIRYVVPSDFRGAIALAVAQSDSAQPTRVADNAYQVVIPESGRVDLSAKSQFDRWHTEAAAYSDGRRLPLGIEVPEHDLLTVALWTLYTDGDGTIWKFVGNKSEMRIAISVVRLSPGWVVDDVAPVRGEEAIARPYREAE